MTIGDIATKARSLVNSDSNAYSNASVLIDINIWQQKMTSMILESMDGDDYDDLNISTSYPIATRPLVAGQRDYRFDTASWTLKAHEGGSDVASQALLPLKIKRVDVTYDGSTWYESRPLDVGEIDGGIGNTTNTDKYFAKNAPRHDIQFNAIWVYPNANADDVTNGAKLQLIFDRSTVDITSAQLTTGTLVPGFDSMFHPMLAYGAAFERATERQLPQLATIASTLQDYEVRLRQHYSRKSLDRRLALMPDIDSDTFYWNMYGR